MAGGNMLIRVLVVTLAVIGTTGAIAGRQVDVRTWIVNPPLTGRDTFEFYCATCHGRSGTGDGPLASELVTPPTDLTTLSARNGSQFPSERVRELITRGRADTAAHGTPDMPVWGPIFRALESPDDVVETRLDNLVRYLESLQSD